MKQIKRHHNVTTYHHRSPQIPTGHHKSPHNPHKVSTQSPQSQHKILAHCHAIQHATVHYKSPSINVTLFLNITLESTQYCFVFCCQKHICKVFTVATCCFVDNTIDCTFCDNFVGESVVILWRFCVAFVVVFWWV